MKHPRAPLIDQFGRHHTYLRVSVTDRCNLRCCYCMPDKGISFSKQSCLLSFEEITRVVHLLGEMGVKKVRLTGGEPLVRSGLENLVASLASIPGVEQVCMTTNGVLLANHVMKLYSAGLTSINISLDSLKPDCFQKITGQDRLHDVQDGIEKASQASFDSLKLNVVVMKGINDNELLDFVRFSTSHGIDIRFIEFMPFHSNDWSQRLLVPAIEMRKKIQEQYDLIPIFSDHVTGRIANEYRIPGMHGTVGFIASMSEEFCEDCSRLRLLADGGIKTCLFGPVEGNLRDAMRSGADDDDLEFLLRSWIELKPERHAHMNDLKTTIQIPMVSIGG